MLQKAINRGDVTARAILGEALYKGEPAEIGKDTKQGLTYLGEACAAGDPDAKDFFAANQRYSSYCQ